MLLYILASILIVLVMFGSLELYIKILRYLFSLGNELDELWYLKPS